MSTQQLITPCDVETRSVVVLGSSGQVGQAFLGLLKVRGVGLTRAQLDLVDLSRLPDLLDELQPSLMINTAAYTQVDRAETEQALAFKINGEAPGVLARACAARQIPFVHFSTDYVFSGRGERPWTEEDPVAPLSAYGRSKAEGERQVAAAGGQWLMFRTSWVYAATGKNFLTTILRSAREREVLRVVDDQRGAPTYAPQLAEAAMAAVERASRLPTFPAGIYHLCHRGETTWYGFAKAIIEAARAQGLPLSVTSINPIPSSAYPSLANRPANSRLSTAKAEQTFDVRLPDWRLGLAACMERYACT